MGVFAVFRNWFRAVWVVREGAVPLVEEKLERRVEEWRAEEETERQERGLGRRERELEAEIGVRERELQVGELGRRREGLEGGAEDREKARWEVEVDKINDLEELERRIEWEKNKPGRSEAAKAMLDEVKEQRRLKLMQELGE